MYCRLFPEKNKSKAEGHTYLDSGSPDQIGFYRYVLTSNKNNMSYKLIVNVVIEGMESHPITIQGTKGS